MPEYNSQSCVFYICQQINFCLAATDATAAKNTSKLCSSQALWYVWSFEFCHASVPILYLIFEVCNYKLYFAVHFQATSQK